MSYTLEDFTAMLDGESTKYTATYAEDKWGVSAGDPYDPEYSESMSYFLTEEETPFYVEGMGRVELAVKWGGQGDGALTGNVVKVTSDFGEERFFEQTGRYSSWDSTYYGPWAEVRPVEKTVVRYAPLETEEDSWT